MRTISVLLVTFLSISAYPQSRTFRWQDELCTYTGTYNARKISASQLKNTWELARPGGFSLERRMVVWKYDDISRLNVEALDTEYARRTAKLKSLNIADAPYWQEFRRRKLREIEQVYRLERATMQAYRQPGLLLQYPGADICRTRFAVPLSNGGDELLKAWREVNEASRAMNSDPDRLRREFDSQMASADRLKYALVEVMSFGWFNCANDLIDYIEYDGTPEREFKKLFTRVRTVRCDEP